MTQVTSGEPWFGGWECLSCRRQWLRLEENTTRTALHPVFFPPPPAALSIGSCCSEHLTQISRQGRLTHFLTLSQSQRGQNFGLRTPNP